MSGITLLQVFAAMSFKSKFEQPLAKTQDKGCLSRLINVDNWKNRRYVIWVFSVAIMRFGFVIPKIHLVSRKMTFEFSSGFIEHQIDLNIIFDHRTDSNVFIVSESKEYPTFKLTKT